MKKIYKNEEDFDIILSKCYVSEKEQQTETGENWKSSSKAIISKATKKQVAKLVEYEWYSGNIAIKHESCIEISADMLEEIHNQEVPAFRNGFIEWQRKKVFIKCNKHLTWNTVQISEYVSSFTTDWLEGGTGHYVLRLDRETIQIFSLQRNDIIFAIRYDEDTNISGLYLEHWDEELKTQLNFELEIIKHPTGVQTISININEN